MKLDRLNEYVLVTTVMVAGTLLAVVCGRLAGSGDKFWLMALAALVGAAVICLTMRTKIWMLIPMFWVMAGQMNSLPFRMPFRDLVVALVVVYFLSLKAFKVIHFKPVYTWLDFVMALNLLYLLSVYIRNPVGANVFGTDLVGGRPYMEVVFAVAAYWVLNQIVITPGQAKVLPILFAIVPALLAIVSTITYLFPATVPILGSLYGGVDAESYYKEQRGPSVSGGEEEGDSRAQYLSGVGTSILGLLCSYLSPLSIFNPYYIWRFLAAMVAFYFCLKSGHRITIPTVTAILLLSTYFRKGIRGLFIMTLITIPPLLFLITFQGRLFELPDTAQRTLSIFPGDWDPVVVSDAQGSTDWRVEMWQIVMTESKYIHNKTFGDGFGFTRSQLSDMAAGGSQEDFMIVGDVHSGPISTIHTVGYIGLGLFICLLVGSAIRAWRLIRATKGTPFFPAALLVGIGCIYYPIGFILIFGAYGNDLVSSVVNVAYLNLLSNGFNAYRKSINEPPTPVPSPMRPALRPAPVPVAALLH